MGDTSKSFTVTAVDDQHEDNGEMLKVTFGALPNDFVLGSPATTTITLMNDDSGTNDDCEDAIWCATVYFRYESEYRIEDSSISDNEFTYDGHQYRVPGVWVDRHSIGNETPRPPFRIPERSRFNLQFETCRRSTVQQDTMSVNDVPAQPKDGVPVTVVCGFTDDSYEDWTLHVEYDDVEVELPFHEARLVPGDQFRWWGIEFYQLHIGWTSGKEYRLRIVETPRENRVQKVPGPPLYLSLSTMNPYDLRASWTRPQPRDDDDNRLHVDSYKIQWKASSGSWDTPADVSEEVRIPTSNNPGQSHEISGLTGGTEYEVRVIATNSAGRQPAVELGDRYAGGEVGRGRLETAVIRGEVGRGRLETAVTRGELEQTGSRTAGHQRHRGGGRDAHCHYVGNRG